MACIYEETIAYSCASRTMAHNCKDTSNYSFKAGTNTSSYKDSMNYSCSSHSCKDIMNCSCVISKRITPLTKVIEYLREDNIHSVTSQNVVTKEQSVKEQITSSSSLWRLLDPELSQHTVTDLWWNVQPDVVQSCKVVDGEVMTYQAEWPSLTTSFGSTGTNMDSSELSSLSASSIPDPCDWDTLSVIIPDETASDEESSTCSSPTTSPRTLSTSTCLLEDVPVSATEKACPMTEPSQARNCHMQVAGPLSCRNYALTDSIPYTYNERVQKSVTKKCSSSLSKENVPTPSKPESDFPRDYDGLEFLVTWDTLANEFGKSAYCGRRRKDDLARRLQMHPLDIQRWFKNARRRARKKAPLI